MQRLPWMILSVAASGLAVLAACGPAVAGEGGTPTTAGTATAARTASTAGTAGTAATAAATVGKSLSGATESAPPEYGVQAGDLLTVTVWKEQDLTGDVLVRPDGGISFPLVGDLEARGKTVEELRKEITERLVRYIPSPVVTVVVKGIGGNHIYVVGKVLRPGEYPIVRPIDVMQALSLAGGATPYAALNRIVILHRENGRQRAFHFRYSEVARGRDLSQNILLQSGDTVVVP